MLKKLRHSLSLRLLLLFVIASILIALILKYALGLSLQERLAHHIRPHMKQAHYIVRNIGRPPSIEQAQKLSAELPFDIVITGPETRWASHGEFPDLADVRFRPPRHPPSHLAQNDPQQFDRTRRPRPRIGVDQGHLIMVVDRKPWQVILITQDKILPDMGWNALIASLGVLSVLGLLYVLIRRLFRPLQTIQASVSRIGSGELEHRIPQKTHDELGDLTQSINQMADDIQHMLEAKRQLLLALSHELRSPLTRAKVSVALLEDSPYIANLRHDLQEMEDLITELLEAERLNNRHQALNLQDAHLNDLVQQVVQEHFSAEQTQTLLDINLDTNIPLQALDEVRIRFVIRNLIDNALKHQDDKHKPIQVKTVGFEHKSQLIVEDHGSGIAAEHLPHLTEPFYRADPSRQRKTGGYGLGLYLCRLIAEAHGGTLQIESTLSVGTTITLYITIPSPN